MKRQVRRPTSTLMIRYALMIAATAFFLTEGMSGATAGLQQPFWSMPMLNAGGLIGPSAGENILLNTDRNERQKPDTTVARTDESAPYKLTLEQNYPNPFRSSTSIRYGLPQETYVRITIHTAIGPVIKVLVDERQPAGMYTLDLSIPELSPGIYFYQIQTEYGALTRRMTIAR